MQVIDCIRCRGFGAREVIYELSVRSCSSSSRTGSRNRCLGLLGALDDRQAFELLSDLLNCIEGSRRLKAAIDAGTQSRTLMDRRGYGV